MRNKWVIVVPIAIACARPQNIESAVPCTNQAAVAQADIDFLTGLVAAGKATLKEEGNTLHFAFGVNQATSVSCGCPSGCAESGEGCHFEGTGSTVSCVGKCTGDFCTHCATKSSKDLRQLLFDALP